MDSIYEIRRQGWRLECGDSCQLRIQGAAIPCTLVDISISGVLVSGSGELIQMVNEGDECAVVLSADSSSVSREIACRVVRKDADRIGLQFPD